MTDQTKAKWFQGKCDEMETLEREGRYDILYIYKKKKATELMFKKWNFKSNHEIETSDGRIICNPVEVKERWKRYVEWLYECQNKTRRR